MAGTKASGTAVARVSGSITQMHVQCAFALGICSQAPARANQGSCQVLLAMPGRPQKVPSAPRVLRRCLGWAAQRPQCTGKGVAMRARVCTCSCWLGSHSAKTVRPLPGKVEPKRTSKKRWLPRKDDFRLLHVPGVEHARARCPDTHSLTWRRCAWPITSLERKAEPRGEERGCWVSPRRNVRWDHAWDFSDSWCPPGSAEVPPPWSHYEDSHTPQSPENIINTWGITVLVSALLMNQPRRYWSISKVLLI